MEVRSGLEKGKISIIVPIYNAEPFLKDCFSSIESQSYSNFEVLCVNDGSTDRSASICEEFIEKDSRFILLNQSNQGVSAARNNALSKAKGEYIVFVDADDMIEPHFLENLLSLSEAGAFAVCSYSREANKLTVKGIKQTRYEANEFIRHIINESINHPNIWMMLFKNSIIQMQHLDFTVGCVRNEDTEFYMKYLVYEKEVVASNYKGYYYRINPNSVMHSGLSIKSLTSIEAQERISDYLVEKGLFDADNYILSNSVQGYVLSAARNNHIEIYDYLHEKYDVRLHMKKELHHPRVVRKCVSLAYLLLGRKVFFKILSLAK